MDSYEEACSLIEQDEFLPDGELRAKRVLVFETKQVHDFDVKSYYKRIDDGMRQYQEAQKLQKEKAEFERLKKKFGSKE